MELFFRSLLIQTSFVLLPLAAVAILVAILKREKARSREPFESDLARPAGESLRLKLADLEEKISDAAAFTIGLPAVIGVMLSTSTPIRSNLLALIVMIALALAASAGGSFRIYRLARARSNHELGFRGERYVAEALTPLHARGYRVFHDVLFDGYNVDHVAVGPGGVFAIETKTRRKRSGRNGLPDHKAQYDGQRLIYPWGSDTHGLEQAMRNAETLSRWLSSALAERIAVEPILALPGWFVERKARGPVRVVSAKELPLAFPKEERLTEKLCAQICHQLEQKALLASR
jgi:hypothetical protein